MHLPRPGHADLALCLMSTALIEQTPVQVAEELLHPVLTRLLCNVMLRSWKLPQ